MPAFTPQPQSIIALWLVLISYPAEGRRLSWPGKARVHGWCRQAPVLRGGYW